MRRQPTEGVGRDSFRYDEELLQRPCGGNKPHVFQEVKLWPEKPKSCARVRVVALRSES